jgi:hypothetical protein
MSALSSICVYPLSPTYLPLHRYLYYVSLTLSVLYPTPPPLVKGAFAFSLSYSSTAALYAFLVTAIYPYGPIVNLDIFGLWAILSSATIVILPLLQWTKNLKGAGSASARPIIRIWGVLVIVATICIFVLLAKLKPIIDQSEDLEGVIGTCQLISSSSETPRLRLRNPEDVLLAAYEPVFGQIFDWIIRRISGLVFLPATFGLITCLFTVVHHPPMHQEDRTVHGDFPSTSTEPTLFFAVQNGFVYLRTVVVCLTPLLLIPTIVINEFYLMKGRETGLIEGEKIYEVGQWGVWVGAGLVGAAALVNSIARKTKRTETKVVIGGGIGDVV